MSKVAAAFAPARHAVSWAEDATAELTTTLERFFRPEMTELITDFDALTGEHVEKVRLRQSLPREVARKATEALTTAKHAFDQATYAAKILTSAPPKKDIYFPWSRGPVDLEHLLRSRVIDSRLWAVFQAHEPYPQCQEHSGGDTVIRTLATLANRKHTLGLLILGEMISTSFPTIEGVGYQEIRCRMPYWDTKKNEAELFRWKGNVKTTGNYHINFQVVFDNTGLPVPINVIVGLKAFVGKAKAFTDDLQLCCQQIAD